MAEKKLADWKKVGEVVHYFPHPEAAIIKLSKALKVGDQMRIVGGMDTDFEQKVNSIEVDKKQIKKGKKGNEVGVKVKEKVREGYLVYKE